MNTDLVAETLAVGIAYLLAGLHFSTKSPCTRIIYSCTHAESEALLLQDYKYLDDVTHK